MTTLTQVYSQLRRKNSRQYLLLAGCCFFAVLLITAYVCMMRSPTVLDVLPEGGDSRKQVMMIFALAVVGCGVFTTYAAGLFFRYKSRETGIFLALGASKRQLRTQLTRELAAISLLSCAAGALLGAPLAFVIWQGFRLALVDTKEMALTFDPQAGLYALAFSAFVVAMIFLLLHRFIRRTNIIDVVNESRKSESIRDVPRWYGWVGILLILVGGFLGYMFPTFCVDVLHWYPPEAVSGVFYAPALAGLYMVLLHTVVNGWRQGKNRYKNIIPNSMMKFQGRQTVRNMLVITVLVAGAYFGSFYTPMLGTSSVMGFDARRADYAFHYRADQNLPDQAEIEKMAAEENVTITSYAAQPAALLGVDGMEYMEYEGDFGTTYDRVYNELERSETFMSESAYTALTGEAVDLAPGTVTTVFDDEGNGGYMADNEVSIVTNVVTGQTLAVKSVEPVMRNTMLIGMKIMDDGDYAAMTEGLPDDWRMQYVSFNVENVDDTYPFAKRLFNEIADRSGDEVAVFNWDPVVRARDIARDGSYFYDRDTLMASGNTYIDYAKRDSSDFRMYWDYMPQFRVMDRAEFTKTTAVFLMLFVFISLVCFAAVIVIAYTRSLTIALTGGQVYDDLRHLGASNAYLRRTVKGQISKVFFVPILTGTVVMLAFYALILFMNDGGMFSASELAGMGNCLILVAVISAALYGVYRLTLRKVCGMLNIH